MHASRQLSVRRPRIAAIDGLRALACLMVLAYHTSQFAYQHQPWPVRHLAGGVDIFIVLSGFCLFLPVTASPDRFSARRFFRQRARRIVPAYYASMVALA